VRSHARKVFAESGKPKKCAVCGYDKHVEICHVREIATFPPETPVREINDLTNLVALCPNHHWELDHGLLRVGPTGFEPV
jgi:predicted restriction endonuclease